jgi:hypothetical protein
MMGRKRMTREEKIHIAAGAIANARGGRNGVPPVSNILELLRTVAGGKLLQEVREDAEAALDALEKAEVKYER